MGLSFSPAVLESIVDFLLKKVVKVGSDLIITSYADDILISGNSVDELEHQAFMVRLVFEEYGFTINQLKTKRSWLNEDMTILGMKLSRGFIGTRWPTLNKLWDIRQPLTMREMAEIIGEYFDPLNIAGVDGLKAEYLCTIHRLYQWEYREKLVNWDRKIFPTKRLRTIIAVLQGRKNLKVQWLSDGPKTLYSDMPPHR
jgi:hypothetical protein